MVCSGVIRTEYTDAFLHFPLSPKSVILWFTASLLGLISTPLLHSQSFELTLCCSLLFCSICPFPFVIFLAASVHLASLPIAWFGPPLPASEIALLALLGVPTSHTRTPQGYRAVVASYLEDAPRLLILGLVPDVEVTRLIYFQSEQLTELYS